MDGSMKVVELGPISEFERARAVVVVVVVGVGGGGGVLLLS